MKILMTICICSIIILSTSNLFAQIDANSSGQQIMEEVHKRHGRYPHVYEEQSMILMDKSGFRNIRKLKKYSRIEDNGQLKILLLFESPKDVKGVALLAFRDTDGTMEKYIYLPAHGKELIHATGKTKNENFLGSDYSIKDLTEDISIGHEYVRNQDMKISGIPYYIVDVYPDENHVNSADSHQRHYIRQDNLYISRKDYFDEHDRLYKTQKSHDLRQVDGTMWRANMISMENKIEGHQSLIKVDRRFLSRDYVPANLFTAEWLYTYLPPPDQNSTVLANSLKVQ